MRWRSSELRLPPRCRLLPQPAADLLEQLKSLPRLAAHPRVVHDVACQIVDWTDRRDPALSYDRDAMRFGAATHDIGKTIHLAELSEPGSAQEEAGRQLLLAHGISPGPARFAAAAGQRLSAEVVLRRCGRRRPVTRAVCQSGRSGRPQRAQPAWTTGDFLLHAELLQTGSVSMTPWAALSSASGSAVSLAATSSRLRSSA